MIHNLYFNLAKNTYWSSWDWFAYSIFMLVNIIKNKLCSSWLWAQAYPFPMNDSWVIRYEAVIRVTILLSSGKYINKASMMLFHLTLISSLPSTSFLSVTLKNLHWSLDMKCVVNLLWCSMSHRLCDIIKGNSF